MFKDFESFEFNANFSQLEEFMKLVHFEDCVFRS